VTSKQEALSRLREVHLQIDSVVEALDKTVVGPPHPLATDLAATRHDLKRVREWIERQP
jgi:hypothetical protein